LVHGRHLYYSLALESWIHMLVCRQVCLPI
jgi:hypothetical protein